jgi:hypothetical protein
MMTPNQWKTQTVKAEALGLFDDLVLAEGIITLSQARPDLDRRLRAYYRTVMIVEAESLRPNPPRDWAA